MTPDPAQDATTPAAADVPDDALQQQIADEVTGGEGAPVQGTEAPPVHGEGDRPQGSR